MAKKAHKFNRVKLKEGDITVDLHFKHIEKNFNNAQYALDSAVMTSMVPYMPMQNGTFINVTRGMSQAVAGSGIVYAAAPPMGRYLYEGVKMVDSVTGKGPAVITTKSGDRLPRFRKGAKLKPTTDPLQYSTHAHPDVTDHWFDTAKEKHVDDWVKTVKKEMGK